MRRIVSLFMLAYALMALPLPAAQSDNRGIHAVPVPGKVVIDGKLDDWDLSGQIFICYDMKTLKDIYSGRVAMMYDDEALYVSIHWKDPVPMGNSHDPQFQPGRGWAGDCVQLRVKTDRITHVTAWLYAQKQEPFINLEYGKSITECFGGGGKNIFRQEGWRLDDGAEMAFLKDEDGKGYVQEIKLPWQLITLEKKYQAGDKFACGIELLWGEADWPVHRYADNIAEGHTKREFFWTAKDAWGPVILEPKGNLKLPTPAWLQAIEEEKPEGPVAIAYDLPRDSRVTIALEDSQGRRVRNLLAAAERKAGKQNDLWDCLDDKGELVPTGIYKVKGIYHDGLHISYVMSFASPGKPGWPTADGKGAYYSDHTAPFAAAMAEDCGALACPMGEAGRHLIGVDLQGRRQWGLANRMFGVSDRVALATDGKVLWIASSEGAGRFFIWRCDLKTGAYAPWQRQDKDGKAVLDLIIREKDGGAHCRAIAWRSGILAVILAAENKILLLDAETGDIRKEMVDMPANMTACAFVADGRLALAAGDKLFLVDSETGKMQTLVEGLDSPQGIAVDKEGNIYISQRGAKMCVEVFAGNGEKLRNIGKSGGRPATGFFDPTGMLMPGQISIDGKGRLWVPESVYQPKRTSVWNTGDGTLAFDLIGTTAYAAGGQINPFDLTRGYSEMVEYKIDMEKHTWRPIFTFPDALGTGFDWIAKVARSNGKEYIQCRGAARASGMVKLYVREADGSWRHCAEWGNVGLGKSLDEPYHKEWNRKFAAPLWQGLFGKKFLWIDRNEDGQAQREEIEAEDGGLGGYYWGQAMGDDLTVVIPSAGELLFYMPEGVAARGTPLYSLAKARRVKPEIRLNSEGMIMVGRDSRVYLNQSPLCAVSSDGNLLWTYPSDYVSVHGSHHAPAPRPGLLIGPSSFYGTAPVNDEIGEIFYLNGNLGQNFIFTEDGLWVQSLFNDCRGWFDQPQEERPGMPCDAMTAGGESFGGWFCKAANGKYYACGGSTAALVFEITGLDSLKRFGGEVEVTAEHLKAANDLRIKVAAKRLQPKVYTVRRTDKPLAADGSLEEWDMPKDSVEIVSGRSPIGLVKALYDDRNLYVAWQVNDSSPLKNSGQDERLLFITGDCVDIMLRTNPEAKDDKPVAGDLRLLIAPKNGEATAVLYQPVAPGADKSEAAALSSPWRSVHFDRIKTVKFPLTMKSIQGGYVVTAAIPLDLLGLQSPRGKSFKADFGILGSDSAGQECTSRNYWCNKTTNNTNDIPDEAQLTPNLWGEIRFE